MKTMNTTIPLAVASAIVLLLLVPFRDAEAHGLSVTVSGQVIVTTVPTVYVAPAPPPVVITPLPPPPPPVVVQPAPVVVIKQSVVPPGPPPFDRKVGLGLRLDGAIHSHETKNGEGMGGAGLLLRMRLKPHFGMEIALDALGGKGYAGVERLEIPASMSFLWYPGRHWSVAQFYLLTGLGAAWARVGENPNADRPIYLGALAGLGLEIRLGSRLAIFGDVRGFIRHRMNDRPDDPAVPTDGSCKASGECTDWEGGGMFSLGLIAYF
jgi:hypothetical protein